MGMQILSAGRWFGVGDYFIFLLAIQRNGIVCQDSLVHTYLEALFYLRLQLIQNSDIELCSLYKN